ncbi:phosphoglycerate dehydrogenase [Enterococcus pallens]|uniref:Phosphoglycerate dehydrogenase n=1 Tax=Enterococcus pallens ATCC BAA-351 TaxID=1158607 RepID=R2SM15_9ENTE|nr:phosphoglycerate dehydrogenase [Enterococcus pallens]EOH93891.1 hypothetical protein UAU_02587 [Enterococcus pallens ATCC BAA-351]EOU24731.1 hypothetical protein I588_00718 [Enterococcus pallens ATCC BAA-351]
MKKIVITPRGFAAYGQKQKEYLEKQGFQVVLNDTGKPFTPEVFAKHSRDAAGIIVGVDQMDAAFLEKCSHLEAVVKFGVGTDNIDLNVCEERKIQVGRCIGTNTNAVAEFTIGLLFSSARQIATNAQAVKEGSWAKPTGVELYGKKLGIIGFGAIGKAVAQRAVGLGMQASVYDLYQIPKTDLDQYQVQQEDLNTLLKTSDFITIHVPYTETTAQLIDKAAFDKMKDSCILVNTSRGGIVDEQALYQALKVNSITAAASDVFLEEPPILEGWRKDLFQLPNFTPTAHIASRSQEAEMNTVQRATELIVEYLE